MSTIKSSDEHLTLNADGSSKDIKFQANGVEKASISSAGAFTSTTIDATKLTGDLPAISGAALTGVGVAGITSSADATAITINSSEQVGIGIGSPTVPLQVRTALSSVGQSTPETVLLLETTANSGGDMSAGNGTRILFKIADDETNPSVGASVDAVRANGDDSVSSTDLVFSTSQNDETLDEALRITNDGRGISKFTAHAWGKINGTGTPSLLTGHNVSSITDQATGRYRANYTNTSGGANTVVVSGQNNNYYDEIYYLDVDESNGSKAAFGCSRSGSSAGWFDTYKMSFVTFTLQS